MTPDDLWAQLGVFCDSHGLCLALNEVVTNTRDGLIKTITGVGDVGWLLISAFIVNGLLLSFLKLDFSYDDLNLNLKPNRSLQRAFRSAWPYPKRIWSSKSFRMDLKLIVFNQTAFTVWEIFLFPFSVAAYAAAFSPLVVSGLSAEFGQSQAHVSGGLLVNIVYSLILLIAFDLGEYIGHRLMHEVAVLWEFHKVHHSATVLSPTTALRTHIVDRIVTALPSGALMALASALFSYGFHPMPVRISLLGTSAMFLIFRITNTLQHSHIWWAWGRFQKVFSSPAMHILHHSCDPKHWNKNMGFVFSIWDHLFGTYAHAEKQPAEEVHVGLGVADGFDWENESVGQYFVRPIRRAISLLARGRGGSSG